MRIQGVNAGFDTGIVDRIMEAEKAPVDAAKERRGRVVAEKNEYSSLSGMLGELGKAANSLKVPSGFRQLAFNSSHPDILDGVVDGAAMPGNYEFEVRGLASADKHLDMGFPDRDKTPVGFGFMQIEKADGKMSEVIVNPGATLNDVVNRINSSGAGVRASVVNTGFPDDPFKLMVVSEATGEAAKVHLDPDTTFLDFNNIKAARNLDVKFEDVGVTRANNKLDDLVDGVKINAKRAEPGTRVQVNIVHDLDKTMANIKQFTDKYNQVTRYANQQFQVDPSKGKVSGGLAGDGNLRSVMRSLQAQVTTPGATGGKYSSMAEVGITTNAKTGELEVDERKLKSALASDYEGVAKLFTVSEEGGVGIAARMADAVHRFQDPVSGVLAGRVKSLDTMIRDQDQQIERQTQRLDERKASLERQFSAMQSRVSALNAQGEVLSSRFGGGEAEAAPMAQGGVKNG